MSESIPERADVRQLRTQAKELLRSLQSGETRAEGVLPGTAKLADAQRLIARKYGFDSWPKLVDQVEIPILIGKFKDAVSAGDAVALEKLLHGSPGLRSRIDDPLFHFDRPALVAASGLPNAVQLLPILVRYGADPNGRSKWWAGSFGALDSARGETVDVLLQLGTKWDVWSAAGHGRIDVLRELLDQDPASLNAPGGDGGTPLHFAADAEVAKFLLDRGADPSIRDIDHEGTPIQHHVNEPEILRLLLQFGATPDIFTAVALDDVDLLRQVLRDDPEAANASVGNPPFATQQSNGGHIYLYKIGPNQTPHMWAAKLGHRKVLSALVGSQSPSRQLVAAAWLGDGEAVAAILAKNPGIGKEMGSDARAITDAAQQGRIETLRLLLKAGLDPKTPGMDGGSALHIACWFGHIDTVRLLVDQVPLDLVDATHSSPPLGWAAHGAQWCRNPAGDYVAVVEALLEAGADPLAPANSGGTSMIAQAGKREDVKEVLRRHGASPKPFT